MKYLIGQCTFSEKTSMMSTGFLGLEVVLKTCFSEISPKSLYINLICNLGTRDWNLLFLIV